MKAYLTQRRRIAAIARYNGSPQRSRLPAIAMLAMVAGVIALVIVPGARLLAPLIGGF